MATLPGPSEPAVLAGDAHYTTTANSTVTPITDTSTPIEIHYVDGYDKPHDGDVVLEAADGARFYFRWPLLCEISSVFRDMADLETSVTRVVTDNSFAAGAADRGGTNKHGYTIIALPNATTEGLGLLLDVLRNVVHGKESTSCIAGGQLEERMNTCINAIELAKAYDMPMVRKALVKLATERLSCTHNVSRAESTFVGLIIRIIGDESNDAIQDTARATIYSDYKEMPGWVKTAMDTIDPTLRLKLLEMHLSHYSAPRWFFARLADAKRPRWQDHDVCLNCGRLVGTLDDFVTGFDHYYRPRAFDMLYNPVVTDVWRESAAPNGDRFCSCRPMEEDLGFLEHLIARFREEAFPLLDLGTKMQRREVADVILVDRTRYRRSMPAAHPTERHSGR